MLHMSQQTLALFQSANNLQSLGDDENKLNELSKEIFVQFDQSYKRLSYDDFMRMLIAVERIADYLHQLNHTQYNTFTWEFLNLKTTQSLLMPHETTQSRFSSALLSTISSMVQKLSAEFYQSFDESLLKSHFFSRVVSALNLPDYFEKMREDEIYNKQSFNDSISKAKIFVPQAETLWKVLAHILGAAPNFPRDLLPEVFLLVGEYTAPFPCSWSSEPILRSISEIKNIFSKPPSTPSSVLGEHILKIISISKTKEMISTIGASWCLRQIEYPSLSLHHIIIQFCLTAIENSDYKVKESGFSSLSHVVQNVNTVELVQFQNEIYTVLAPYNTSREAPLLSVALPLTFQFLQKCKKINPLSQSTLDSLFPSFVLGINNALPELSAIYIRSFPALLDLAGVQAITYAAVLFHYLEGALALANVETLDRTSLQDLLTMLKSLVANCWPRVPSYKFQIFQAGVSGVVGKGDKCEDNLIAIVNDILGMLKSCCGDEFKEFDSLTKELKEMYPIVNKLILT